MTFDVVRRQTLYPAELICSSTSVLLCFRYLEPCHIEETAWVLDNWGSGTFEGVRIHACAFCHKDLIPLKHFLSSEFWILFFPSYLLHLSFRVSSVVGMFEIRQLFRNVPSLSFFNLGILGNLAHFRHFPLTFCLSPLSLFL